MHGVIATHVMSIFQCNFEIVAYEYSFCSLSYSFKRFFCRYQAEYLNCLMLEEFLFGKKIFLHEKFKDIVQIVKD